MDTVSLARFRKLLKEQRDALQLRLVIAKRQSRGPGLSEAKEDRASASVAKEMSAAHESQAVNLLVAVNAALDRIDGGTFGECLNCGQAIGPGRLEVIPWARYCITCQELIEGH